MASLGALHRRARWRDHRSLLRARRSHGEPALGDARGAQLHLCAAFLDDDCRVAADRAAARVAEQAADALWLGYRDSLDGAHDLVGALAGDARTHRGMGIGSR